MGGLALQARIGEKEDSRGDEVAPKPHQVSRVYEALRPKKGADHRLVSTMSEKDERSYKIALEDAVILCYIALCITCLKFLIESRIQ